MRNNSRSVQMGRYMRDLGYHTHSLTSKISYPSRETRSLTQIPKHRNRDSPFQDFSFPKSRTLSTHRTWLTRRESTTDRTTHTRISVLEPSTANIRILLINHVLDVFLELLDVIRIHNSGHAGADGEHSDFPRIRPMKNDVCSIFCLVEWSQPPAHGKVHCMNELP